MNLPKPDTRLAELLADRALTGLTEAEVAELHELLQNHPEVDDLALEQAASDLFVGLSGLAIEQPPAALRARLDRSANEFIASRRAAAPAVVPAPPAVAGRIGPSSALPWLAAAACLTVAVFAWWPRLGGTVEAPADIAALVASSPDAVRLAWAPGPDETGRNATGEVVWSDEKQSGYMEFRGLPALDRGKWQYQLWIVDPERDERPVDGGVFDIPATGEAVVRVPIDAKLRVDKPAAFVVTVEQPGGVVVSSQERVALIAAVGG